MAQLQEKNKVHQLCHNQAHANDNDFDDFFESGLRTYKLNYHLTATGTLDSETVSKMMMSRCGVADIIDATNWMGNERMGRDHYGRGLKSFHSVSRYTFLSGSPKWPASKYHLTYAFSPGTPEAAIGPVSRAFGTWSSVTQFTFSQVGDPTNSDIKIGFGRSDHGDAYPFDGRGGTLAHAFAPTTGVFHYDADDAWAVGVVPGAFDLETVALHEIGHLLGLGHSSVEGAIMYPTIADGATKGLHDDDVQGIKALYNV